MSTLEAERVSVVVVDDSMDQRTLIARYFERAGCVVHEAANAEQALSFAEQLRAELMVIDLVLPGMDGWELARRMRDEHPECPIAITSVLGVDRYPAADAALPKPVSGAHIRSLLGQCVPRWAAE